MSDILKVLDLLTTGKVISASVVYNDKDDTNRLEILFDNNEKVIVEPRMKFYNNYVAELILNIHTGDTK